MIHVRGNRLCRVRKKTSSDSPEDRSWANYRRSYKGSTDVLADVQGKNRSIF